MNKYWFPYINKEYVKSKLYLLYILYLDKWAHGTGLHQFHNRTQLNVQYPDFKGQAHQITKPINTSRGHLTEWSKPFINNDNKSSIQIINGWDHTECKC